MTVTIVIFSGWAGILLGIVFILSLFAFLIGICFFFSSLVSFNSFFHEQRGGQTDGTAMIGSLAPFKVLIGLCVSIYAVFVHWNDYKFGRKIFLAGILLVIGSSAAITAIDNFCLWRQPTPP